MGGQRSGRRGAPSPSAPADAPQAEVLRRATVDVLQVMLGVGLVHSALLLVLAGAAGERSVVRLAAMVGALLAWIAAQRHAARVARTVDRVGWALPVVAVLSVVPTALDGGFGSRLANEGLWLTWVAAVATTPPLALATAAALTVGKLGAYSIGTGDAGALTDERLGDVLIDLSLPLLTVVLALALVLTFRTTLRDLGDGLQAIRDGGPASTPGLAALISGRAPLQLPAAAGVPTLPPGHEPDSDPLTPAQRAVVDHLAEGLRWRDPGGSVRSV